MEGYLGEFGVDIQDTPYADYTEKDWALHFIKMYGGIGGDHHKAWVLDQVARILNGTRVVVVEARWDNGHTDYRIRTGCPTLAHTDWVHELREWDPKQEDYKYDYDEGVAP